MPLDITDIAFKDFVYKQNLDDTYEFDSNGNFLPEDRNTIVDTGLVQQPIPMNPIGFGLLNKSHKMRCILLFLSGICSITEVIEQLYYHGNIKRNS